MINQTKTQLFEVFKKFDKDGNGTVESNELIAISKEMNEEITQQDVERLMAVVDVNKDGKIQFEEFWDWWQFGKNQKLERLVFLKLKLMNSLKSMNSEFTRFGVSLEQQYEPNLDHHYWAVNYGDFQPHFKLQQKIRYKGSGVKEEIQTELGVQQSDNLQFVIIIKAVKPDIAKQNLESLWEEFKQALKQKPEIYYEIQMIVEQFLVVEFTSRKDSVAVTVEVNHPIVQMVLQQAYLPYCAKLGEQMDISIDFSFGIKNGLAKMMKKDQIFIKYLLEGFIMELKAAFNSDLAKKIFGLFLQMFGRQLATQVGGKKGGAKYDQFILPLLFRSSKFHLQFKNMEDVDKFLKSMGLQELADDQPSARQLLQELIDEQQMKEFIDPKALTHFIYKLYKVLSEHFYAIGSVSGIIPNAYASLQFNLEGLKDVFDAIFREDAESKKKQKR